MGPRAAMLALLLLATASRATTVEITDCGQTVPDRALGVLTTDVVCTSSATSVFVGERAKLDFRGHTITAGGVWCHGACSLRGPGTIADAQPWTEFGQNSGIFTGTWDGKLTAKNLTIDNCFTGIASNASKVTLSNVVVTNSTHNGINVYGRLRAKDVTASDNGDTGVFAAGELAQVKVVGLTATGNGWGGLSCQGSSTVVVRSTLTGNSFPPFPGTPTALDLISVTMPRVVDTTCDYSWGDGAPWGVCAGD
jgi:hypothetical protein